MDELWQLKKTRNLQRIMRLKLFQKIKNFRLYKIKAPRCKNLMKGDFLTQFLMFQKLPILEKDNLV